MLLLKSQYHFTRREIYILCSANTCLFKESFVVEKPAECILRAFTYRIIYRR